MLVSMRWTNRILHLIINKLKFCHFWQKAAIRWSAKLPYSLEKKGGKKGQIGSAGSFLKGLRTISPSG